MGMETEPASAEDDIVELSHLIRDLEIESFSSSKVFDVALTSTVAETLKKLNFDLKNEENEVEEDEQILKNKDLDLDISLEKSLLAKKENSRTKERSDLDKDDIARNMEKEQRRTETLLFEQDRMKPINVDLTKHSADIKSLNLEIVSPDLDKKRLDLEVAQEESEGCQKEVEKAISLREELTSQLEDSENDHSKLHQDLTKKEEHEREIAKEPGNFRKKMECVQKSILDREVEYHSLQEQISEHKRKILEQHSRRKNLISLRSDLENEIKVCNVRTTECDDQYATIAMDITMAQTQQHNHATTRLQLEIKMKESREKMRHQSSSTMLQKKQYNRTERLYVKKKYALQKMTEVLDRMKSNIEECEINVRNQVKENKNELLVIEKMKDEMNAKLSRWLEQENIEKSMKDNLKSIAEDVEEKESETQKWIIEKKKLLKLLSILKIQRDIQIRKRRNVENSTKETEETAKLKKLLVLDLTKVLIETNKRIEEFSALYKILKNERNEVTSSTTEANNQLLEINQRVKEQQSELQTLSNTKELKNSVLNKEKDAYESSRTQRAILRVEKTNARESYRQKRDEVERQLVKVNRAKAALMALKREQEGLKNRNARLKRSKKVMSKQLEDKKIDIHKLLQRANIYEDILKKGEAKIQEKKEDMRALVLKSVDIERYLATKRDLHKENKEYEVKIEGLNAALEIERKQKDALSAQLEDPKVRNGWRELNGHDLDEEQLEAKINMLLYRFGKNKDRILEKEIMIEELDENIVIMEKDVKSLSTKLQPTINKLNECRYRLRDITRSMMASVSELSMYQATAIKLEEAKVGQEEEYEKELVFERRHKNNCSDSIATGRELADVTNHNHSYQHEKIYYPAPYALRTTAEPRPISYISEANLGLPKPYGSMAPFKPSDCAGGSTMRHIRPPAMKQLS